MKLLIMHCSPATSSLLGRHILSTLLSNINQEHKRINQRASEP